TLGQSLALYQDKETKREKIHAAGAKALEAQRLSLKDLKEGQWAYVSEAQQDAAATLASFQSVFKNHELAAGIGVMAILVLLGWGRIARGRLKVIPAPLVAVTFATFAAAYWQ